jgi:signal transduction histidine kinase
MRKPLLLAAVLAASWAASPVGADEFGTAKEAESMVKAAVSHIKTVGKDRAYSDFTAKKPPFYDRDLYVVVYGLDGKIFAHGQNSRMVGKDMIDMKDPDGKPFVRERVEMAQTKASFWQDYKFTDPVTKKVLPKAMYCERMEETVVCSGIYKRT